MFASTNALDSSVPIMILAASNPVMVPIEVLLRRSLRQTKAPSWLANFQTNFVHQQMGDVAEVIKPML